MVRVCEKCKKIINQDKTPDGYNIADVCDLCWKELGQGGNEMTKISGRDLEIFHNIKASFLKIPQDKQSIVRKYQEQKKAGLYSIPGSRIGMVSVSTTNEIPYDKLWFLTQTCELNRFFCTLEEKYGFSGHTHTIDEQDGSIIPIAKRPI